MNSLIKLTQLKKKLQYSMIKLASIKFLFIQSAVGICLHIHKILMIIHTKAVQVIEFRNTIANKQSRCSVTYHKIWTQFFLHTFKVACSKDLISFIFFSSCFYFCYRSVNEKIQDKSLSFDKIPEMKTNSADCKCCSRRNSAKVTNKHT